MKISFYQFSQGKQFMIENQLDTNDAEPSYLFLLATHIACADGQIHKDEEDALRHLGQEAGIHKSTWEAMEEILSQSSTHLLVD
jgi:tellurite resistance protein